MNLTLRPYPLRTARYSVRKLLDFPMASACRVEGCSGTTEKGGQGLCGKHLQRWKRYGDVNYVTPREVWLQKCREAQLARAPKAKPTTYKKFHQRHEHRVVAERMLGRPLMRGEIVHHIDGNKHNNDPSNLQVMTQSQHVREHFGHSKKRIEWNGRSYWPSELAAELGLPLSVVHNRLRADWSVDQIASTPVRKWTRKNA